MRDETLAKILQSQLRSTTDEKLKKFCDVISQNSDSSVTNLLLEILYDDVDITIKGNWYKFKYFGHITPESYIATADVNLAEDNYIYGKVISNAYSSRQFQPWHYMMTLKVLFMDVSDGKPKLIYDDFNIKVINLFPNDIDNIEEIIASLNV